MNRHQEAGDLPEYRDPPVIEVAVSVQFKPLESFRVAHLGLLWERFRENFPLTEEHPPLPSAKEEYGPPKAQRFGLTIKNVAPFPRSWFLDKGGNRLIQVQQDRFAVNWRKLETDAEYPRYKELSDRFHAALGIFERFLQSVDGGVLEPNQVELTYVNHIFPGPGWQSLSDLNQVITVWSGSGDESLHPDVYDLSARYLMPSAEKPMGRLYVDVDTPFHREKGQFIRLKLMARGAPVGPGSEGVREFLDRGHEWIVRNFSAMTTERMHAIWGRVR